MHLTREGDYAVRVIVELAGHAPGELVRTAELSRATDVPKPYLAKVVQALARAHLVTTLQGPGGGVALTRDPATITLRAIVEAIEGRIYLNRCLRQPGECSRDVFCTVHPVWARIQALVIRELEAVTARDLAAGLAVMAGPRIARAVRTAPAEDREEGRPS